MVEVICLVWPVIGSFMRYVLDKDLPFSVKSAKLNKIKAIFRGACSKNSVFLHYWAENPECCVYTETK